EAVFEHFGAAVISELDAGDEPTVELTPHAQPGFNLSKVAGLFALDTPVAAVSAALVEALGRDVLIESRIIGEQDWAEAWIAHHPPLYFGGRLWVAPHGADVDTRGGDDVIIRLNPGLAFGTG